MTLRGDGEDRTHIYCRDQQHNLWYTDVAYRPQDAMDPTVWSTGSPGSPYPDEPLDGPTTCPLDGSSLMKAGNESAAQSGVRWLTKLADGSLI